MIKNNNFFIENIKCVVFIGYSEVFKELTKINNSHKLKTLIITSSHQSKILDQNISYKIFDKIDDKFNMIDFTNIYKMWNKI